MVQIVLGAEAFVNILRRVVIENMAIYKSRIEWHDLRIAPDDIPEEGEDVLVTK